MLLVLLVSISYQFYYLKETTYPGLLEVEDCKTAHITNTINVDSELSEKIDDPVTALWQRPPKNEWCEEDTQDFVDKY
jgi:hypothetical protein